MTPDPITVFDLPHLERVISGANSLARVGVELDRLGASRVVLVTGRTLGASALIDSLKRSIGERCVLVFTGARQHVPSGTVTELARVIEEHKANGVVSFGGGSPIDTVKAAQFMMLTAGGDDSPRRLKPALYGSSGVVERGLQPPRQPGGGSTGDGVPHLAIPTTLSAGEFTSVAGITDEQTRIKRPFHDARISPRVVIVDPTVTLQTPDWLWIATGIRSVDHAVETMYSVRHHPVGEAMASRGLALLLEHLPASLRVAGDERIEHRLRCQLAAWLSVFGMTNAGFGLSHALGHQIGPRWNVPHGFTSCMTLPHAMRFMADRAAERFAPIAAGLGLPFDRPRAKESALACADRVEAFIGQFNVPHRLRDAHIPRGEIDEIAGVVRDAMDEAQVVSHPVTRDDIAAVLQAAY